MSGDGRAAPRASESSRRAPTWPRAAVAAALLVLIVIVSRTCQADNEVTQEEAIEIATEQVRFEPDPDNTQIRFLRQDIDRHPYWIVSLSIGDAEAQVFDQLAVVRIDATNGEVVEVRDQSVDGGSGAEGGNGTGSGQ